MATYLCIKNGPGQRSTLQGPSRPSAGPHIFFKQAGRSSKATDMGVELNLAAVVRPSTEPRLSRD